MSKILLPTIDYTPQSGGVARYLQALKDTLNNDVDVLYWKKVPGRLSMLIQLIKGGRAYEQIWVSHVLPIGTMAWLAKFVTKTPYVIFLHGMDFDLARRSKWKIYLLKHILKSAKRVVVNSEALQKEVKRFVGIEDPLIVHPTLPDSLLHAYPEREGLGDQRGKCGKIRLLTVSRLVKRKGHIDVLDAIASMPNIEYWIVGEGGYFEQLESYVKMRKLQDRVKFFGHATDEGIARCYQEADIFVMPTKKNAYDREGFGIVYLEAQFFELPVIASDYGGVNEAVADGVSGILVSNTDELRQAIQFLSERTSVRRKLGEAGRKRVMKLFTRETQFEKLRGL